MVGEKAFFLNSPLQTDFHRNLAAFDNETRGRNKTPRRTQEMNN